MTIWEFFKSSKMRTISKNIFTCSVLGYVLSGLTLYLNVIKNGLYSSIPTVVVLLACSLLIHLLQSRVAAIVLTAYSVLHIYITSITNGRLSGWWVVFIGVYAIIMTFKFQKAWQEEKEFGEGE
jgi:hypothetical protein